MASRQGYKISEMTDEQIEELITSIPSDIETTDDEDDCDLIDDQIISTNTVVSAEEDMLIDENPLTVLTTTELTDISIDALREAYEHSKPSEPTHSEHTCAGALNNRYGRKRRTRSPELVKETNGPSISTASIFSGAVMDIKNDSREFKCIIWKKQNLRLHINDIIFRGDKQLPPRLNELKTPYECFRYLVNDDFIRHITEQSNLYAHQKNIETKFTVDSNDMRKFIGVLVFMSVYRYPNTRSYWGRHAFEPIRQVMPVLRFEEIRRYLHFNNNSLAIDKGQPDYDRLFKVRPLITHFNETFGSVPMLPRLCVDEQMCATKMTGTILRQYMPNKPHKWGFKLFSLCDSSGFSYAFEIYCGAGDNKTPIGAPDLGASSNVVVRLSKNIPNFVNHILYFDNFYTSMGLLTYLHSRGIYSLGTVRSNRVPNCKLSSDAALSGKKVERGYSEEYLGNAYGVDISSVLWQDTKTVRLLSTYVGTKPFISSKTTTLQPQKATRWDKKKQQYEIDCPYIIKEYNRLMGGVDLMDGLLGRYHIRMKTRKWSNRIFFHLIDVAMVNAYILYHRLNLNQQKIKLPTFRTEVAESLCLKGMMAEKKNIGRPSNASEKASPKPVKRAYLPSLDVRYDQVGHWCIFHDRSGKRQCKFPKCTSETQAFCVKCNLSLCNSPTKTCFYKFHNK